MLTFTYPFNICRITFSFPHFGNPVFPSNIHTFVYASFSITRIKTKSTYISKPLDVPEKNCISNIYYKTLRKKKGKNDLNL